MGSCTHSLGWQGDTGWYSNHFKGPNMLICVITALYKINFLHLINVSSVWLMNVCDKKPTCIENIRTFILLVILIVLEKVTLLRLKYKSLEIYWTKLIEWKSSVVHKKCCFQYFDIFIFTFCFSSNFPFRVLYNIHVCIFHLSLYQTLLAVIALKCCLVEKYAELSRTETLVCK